MARPALTQPYRSRARLFLALGAVVSVILFSGLLAVRNTRQLREDAAWVARTHEMLEATQAALATAINAETGQRGYLITSDRRYLEPYQAALAGIRTDTQRLKRLAQGDPGLAQRVLDLDSAIEAKLTELESTIALHDRDPAAARREVLTHLGKNLMDSIRGQAELITLEERALLSQREQTSRQSYRVAIWSGTVTALLGLVMVGGFLVQLLRHLRERERTQAILIQEERDKAGLEAQLQEARRMETLGLLAGGVAHDFNNLLTGILGNASIGSMKAEAGDEVIPFFANIETAAMKAADLTRLLLAYAGKGKYLVTAVDLGVVVRETAANFSSSIPRTVTLQCELPDGLPMVRGDEAQIRQILMSLLANAVEAIADGRAGRISIRTGVEAVVQATVQSGSWPLPVPPGQYGTLEVADTGAGMAPEVAIHAFEPFFSTKFTGRGLGLAAVLGILRSHEGGLQMQSAPGQGSTFKAFLPALPT